MEKPRSVLGSVGTRVFLRDYWQRKPLLIRQALAGFRTPISPDELAGLALEDTVESRIVLEKGRRGNWQLLNGPFKASAFARLPKTRWTLLVQAVDQWVPAVHALREHFTFLPPWRFDDIMVSYAADKGGVGPHFDQYDVFLLQGAGRRRWRIGDACSPDTPYRSDTQLRILKRFTVREEFVLDPGDMLYVPPGVAHWGIAEGECMTFSMGFRAPSHADILLDVSSAVAATSPEDRRYTDPAISAADAGGEISLAAVRRVQRVLREMADDTEGVRDWFGRTMTERKYPELDITPAVVPGRRLRTGTALARNPASRFAWSQGKHVTLFVDGEAFRCGAEIAGLLSGAQALDAAVLTPLLQRDADRLLLRQLLARGALVYGD